jgi:DNA-binding NarL/FixJ family response regulator
MSCRSEVARPETQSGVDDNPRLRVLVVSEQPVILAGLQSWLAASCQVLTTADHHGQSVDVVIYDVLGLGQDDGDGLARVVEQYPDRVLALSRASLPGLAARALQLGVVTLIPLSAHREELVSVIRAAMDGHFHDGSATDLANRSERAHLLGHDLGLSERERQILALVAVGAPNSDIADALYLSINTVKSFVRTSYRKIGVSNRAQAVIWCVEHGFTSSST